jgi:hypothetical protein
MDHTMITRLWYGGDVPLHYLYANEVGRIIGETSLLGHAKRAMHTCTVYPRPGESVNLGIYISCESAKGMIEHYWSQKDNVVDSSNNILGSNT